MPTSPAPETIADTSGSFWPTCRSMFSITTVPLSTRMPTARAKPPSVIVLSVWPPRYITSMAVMIAIGIVARMISVRRQLPRNRRIISAVRPAARRPPVTTLFSAALTKTDWSKIGLIVTPWGSSRLISGRLFRMPSMTVRVETPPVLRMDISAPGVPSTATELVCT